MRRVLAFAALFALTFALTATALSADVGNYRDEFNRKNYSGTDGSEEWSNKSWKELKDDGRPARGIVQIDSGGGDCAGGNCLKISAEGSSLSGVGAQREADTSVFATFELRYEIAFEDDEAGLTDAWIDVERSIDGGNTWHRLARHFLEGEFSKSPSHWIGGPHENTIIRFVVTGYLAGGVSIDDVEIMGELAGGTITATEPDKPPPTEPNQPPPDPDGPKNEPDGPATEVIVMIDNDDPPGGSGGQPEGSGIRQAARGIQADFDWNLFGEVQGGSLAISSVDHQANYRMAAEIIEVSWAWLLVLALVLAWSIVSGLERRRGTAVA